VLRLGVARATPRVRGRHAMATPALGVGAHARTGHAYAATVAAVLAAPAYRAGVPGSRK